MLIGFGIAGRGSLGIWHWRSTLIFLEDARVETANEGLFSSHFGGGDKKAIITVLTLLEMASQLVISPVQE